MRCWLFVLAVALAACSSAPAGPQLPIAGTWQYLSSGLGEPAEPGIEWAWTGSHLFAFGAEKAWQSDSAATLLDPITGVWTPGSAVGSPSPRKYGFSASTGTEVFVWGGLSKGDV